MKLPFTIPDELTTEYTVDQYSQMMLRVKFRMRISIMINAILLAYVAALMIIWYSLSNDIARCKDKINRDQAQENAVAANVELLNQAQ